MEKILKKTHTVVGEHMMKLKPGDVILRDGHYFIVTPDMNLMAWNQSSKSFEENEISILTDDVVLRVREAKK